ncbi:MAG: response regulator [Anaerolineaceae bacterium]|nr:response regulator [Anaerolineaceae bacterium]
MSFAEMLRQYRIERRLTQTQLAEALFVDRTTVVKWENGSRMPDAVTLSRISNILGIDLNLMMMDANKIDQKPKVILVDDEIILLDGELDILQNALPNAEVIGFQKALKAIEFAENNRIALAFLDIKMGQYSGLEICQQLQEINSYTNVVFITAYIDYSFDAWSTGACGFILKPLTEEKVKQQLPLLKYPLINTPGGGIKKTSI